MAESSSNAPDTLFAKFYTDLKALERKDSVLTSKQQIDRLLRPGATYFNLNPFEVLQIDPDSTIDECRKQYRKLSILVHPDKNADDRERAQKSFDSLKKAIEMIEDPERLLRCKEIIIEARARTEQAIQEKRKILKKQAKTPIVEEDDPNAYNKALWIMTMKLFAEKDRKRKFIEERDMDEKKRAQVEKSEAEEKKKIEEEFQKNFEESRDIRVTSWKSFQTKKEKKGKFSKGAFRPPKHRVEQRCESTKKETK